MADEAIRQLKEELKKRDEEDRVKLNTQLAELMGFMNRMVMDVSIIKEQLSSYEGIPAAITRLEQRLEGYESVSQSMTKMDVVIDQVANTVSSNVDDLKSVNMRLIKLEAQQVSKQELDLLRQEVTNLKSRSDESKGATTARATLVAGIMSALGLIVAIIALLMK